MSHVFISYSHEDREYVQRLEAALLERGFDVWNDERIDYGERWFRTIIEAIEGCAAFIVVMTSSSHESEWVEREILFALDKGKPIFPLLLRGERFPLLITTQYVDVTNGRTPSAGFYSRLAKVCSPGTGEGEVVAPEPLPEQSSTQPSDLQRSKRSSRIQAKTGRQPKRPVKRTYIQASKSSPSTYVKKNLPTEIRNSLPPGIGLRPDGLPDIVWCEVPGGTIELEDGAGTFEVEPFYIAKYPITYIQFQAFIDDPDGFHDHNWWEKLAADDNHKSNPGEQKWPITNHPRENVSWFDAVVFCRWLSDRLGYEIRLPTEWEWQQAATGGEPTNAYPWGSEWEAGRTNTNESEIGRTTPVDRYPEGTSPVGALDMAGNVWEWCLNVHRSPAITGTTWWRARVVRGGSWNHDRNFARAAFRRRGSLLSRGDSLGFRVCWASLVPE